MQEAEVTLRLAFWLLDRGGPNSTAQIAIDGANVRIAPHQQAGRQIQERIVFQIEGFLESNGCEPVDGDGWRGTYRRGESSLTIKSRQGFDVEVVSPKGTIQVECKGGPLAPKKGRSTHAILSSAIGQVITCGSARAGNELWVAVPASASFEKAAKKICKSEIFSRTRIRLALVAMDGSVRLVD